MAGNTADITYGMITGQERVIKHGLLESMIAFPNNKLCFIIKVCCKTKSSTQPENWRGGEASAPTAFPAPLAFHRNNFIFSPVEYDQLLFTFCCLYETEVLSDTCCVKLAILDVHQKDVNVSTADRFCAITILTFLYSIVLRRPRNLLQI